MSVDGGVEVERVANFFSGSGLTVNCAIRLGARVRNKISAVPVARPTSSSSHAYAS